MTRIHEYEDLARHLCGIDDNPDVDLDDKLYEKFGIDLVGFAKLAEQLLPLAAIGKSPLTDRVYQGFAMIGADGAGTWLAKREVPTAAGTAVAATR